MRGEREGSRGSTPSGRACLLALVALLPLTAYRSPLTAQTSFQRLRDSLATSSDTAALHFLLRSALRSKVARRDPAVLLQSGLVALRLGELGADPDFSEARSRFRDAARLAPGRPEPWFGRGLAEAGLARWEMSVGLNLGNRVGLKALERSAAHYHRALESDAGYAPAALALAQTTLDLRDTARLSSAAPALERAALTPTAGPEVALAWGRVERAAGRIVSAIAAFERYEASGENRALALLELARTQLASGRRDGDSSYYQGAALADVAVASEYLADIEPLIGDSGIARLTALQGPELAQHLKAFWGDRDRLELRREGERLREHYRRLQYARLHFPLTISRRFYGRLDAYRSGNSGLDDRGVIYIRHGEPSTRLRPFVFGAMPNESWRYVRAEGDLLLHFSAGWDHNGGGDLYDYRLVRSVLDLRGAADAPRDQLLLSRQSLSPTYSRMLNWGRYGAARARALERSIGSESIAVGTTTDTHELEFPYPLGVVADLIAVGRSSAGSLAHLVFGISASGTSFANVDGKARYEVRLRLVALDGLDRPLSSLDTSLAIMHSRPLSKDEFLVGRAEVALPPGKWRYRASLQQGDSAGVVLPRQFVTVAATDGASLALSDIALGSQGRAVPWVTDAADTVLLAPSDQHREGADVELYYEATGATPGHSYRHEITVLRPQGKDPKDRRPLVALSFDEPASDSVIRSQRIVRLDRLKEGSYLVEVKITAPDGESRVRQRSLRVIGA